ncbi:tripartite motif-containing protein 26-like [Patiria miniata]|uniref:RING-type domain-containing protein n=1 Tax=Patiria miniata TaxID=46514 RepID=A0A914BH38_PATMI|nr:tripartite motif-containing protein 26-like [Patiria miniata]
MGLASQSFVSKPDQNLLCGICKTVMKDAVLTRCGHAFCEQCLDTWLARPLSGSCPQCRASVSKFQVSPVWAIREIVSNLTVECDYGDRGCRLVMRVESLEKHRTSCAYAPVECAGCETVVSRYELPHHQGECAKIAATANEPDLDEPRSREWSDQLVKDLENKLSRTEQQLKQTKRRLETSESSGRKLERDLCEARLQLQRKQGECTFLHLNSTPEFDPQYPYGFSPESISKLSLLIACHLLRKPDYMDRNRIFNCVKRCYDSYARCGTHFEQDVHMLVATAYASNWFTENQRINFHCWLQSIARYRKYADLSGPPHPGCTASVIRRTTSLRS